MSAPIQVLFLRRVAKLQSVLLALLLIFLGVILFIFYDLPALDSLPEHLTQPSLRITDRHSRPLYEILPEEGGRHAVLSFGKIPQCMKDATVAVEDKNFYTNPGVDLQGIVRALWINLRGGETIAGGSTITQQVARTLLLDGEERFERTLRRKLREAALAWGMARRFSKEEILALYLNQVNYGGMAYGVEAASQTYFGKPASDLLLPECALLAGLPQAPGLYNPFTNPDLAKERQAVVLGLMQAQGYISEQEQAEASSAPLSYNPAPYPIEAPHFVWIVRAELDRLFADGTLDPRQSLVVRTTLDLNTQHAAESAVTRQIQAFRQEDPVTSHNVNNAAVVALDPHSGEILALVGSADYFDASIFGAVDMASAPRQPGSAFKPFLYAQALTPSPEPARPGSAVWAGVEGWSSSASSGPSSGSGLPWTAATAILDVTTTFITHDGTPYTPVNYDGREHGPVSVRQALASSLNIPAVLTLNHVGIENTTNLARRLGITSLEDPQDYDLSLALGGGTISLLQLSTAYATFANEGLFTGNSAILDVQNADGDLLYTPKRLPPQQVFDPRVTWLINDILSDDRARALGFGLNSTLKLDRTAAVKTGTTTNFHDNWTIGYTPAGSTGSPHSLLVGVWVGNSNYEAMRNVTGLTGAAPIWHEIMRTILQGKPDRPFRRPEGLVQVEVCDLSGLLPTPACPHTRLEWFIEGTEPTEYDTYYQQVWIDALTGQLATEATPPERRQPRTVLDLPLEAQNWAREQGLTLVGDLAQSVTSDRLSVISLLSPLPNTTYRIDPNFEQSAQQVLVEAAAGQGVSNITLWVDESLLARLDSAPYQAWWPLAPGEHRFWAEGVTANGETIMSEVITITVVIP
jgi:membrane peptidoglycan carboxypeptidase